MGERTEQKIKCARDNYIANALSILDFCLANDVSPAMSEWFSTSGILYDTFLYFYERNNGNPFKTQEDCQSKLLQIENNRSLSMLTGRINVRESSLPTG